MRTTVGPILFICRYLRSAFYLFYLSALQTNVSAYVNSSFRSYIRCDARWPGSLQAVRQPLSPY